MAQRSSFAEMRAEQAKMIESWKRKVAKVKLGLSQTRKLTKFFLLESPLVSKWDDVIAMTLPTRRTNGEKHCVGL